MSESIGPSPGIVGVVTAHGTTSSQLVERVAAPFRRKGVPFEVVTDGPMAVAFSPSATRTAYVTNEVVCVFDGSLYNVTSAPRATPAPPAEFLAKAFAVERENALVPLRGDFCAVLWDRRSHGGVVAVDHMGERSPYWTDCGADRWFASELPELLDAIPATPSPDELFLSHWFSLTIAPEGRSFFDGVRMLEAGHVLPVGGGQVLPRRYWAPKYQRALAGSFDEQAERLRASLTEGVRRRIEGVGHVGLLLSGGLDSSVVAVLANSVRENGQILDTYSAVFPGHPTLDESALITRTTQSLGLRSTRIVVEPASVVAGGLAFLDAWRVPPTSPNMFFWFRLLARAGEDGVEMMMAGEGGDELFGYAPYLPADRVRRGRLWSAYQLGSRFTTPPQVRSAALARRMFRRYGLKGAMPPIAHRAMRRVKGPDTYSIGWLRPDLGRAWIETQEPFLWKELRGPRWWAHLVSSVTRGAGPAMAYQQSRRRAAMGGFGARHPLVDVDTIELVLRLPPEYAYDVDNTRPLMRAAVKGLLDDPVRLRQGKSTFDAIFHASMAQIDLPIVRRLLTSPDVRIGAYVDMEVVRSQVLDLAVPDGGYDRMIWAMNLWRMLTAECWLRSQEDSNFIADIIDREGLRLPEFPFLVDGPPA